MKLWPKFIFNTLHTSQVRKNWRKSHFHVPYKSIMICFPFWEFQVALTNESLPLTWLCYCMHCKLLSTVSPLTWLAHWNCILGQPKFYANYYLIQCQQIKPNDSHLVTIVLPINKFTYLTLIIYLNQLPAGDSLIHPLTNLPLFNYYKCLPCKSLHLRSYINCKSKMWMHLYLLFSLCHNSWAIATDAHAQSPISSMPFNRPFI